MTWIIWIVAVSIFVACAILAVADYLTHQRLPGEWGKE